MPTAARWRKRIYSLKNAPGPRPGGSGRSAPSWTEAEGGGLTAQLPAENNKHGPFPGCILVRLKKKNTATPLVALLAAPSTGLPGYIRAASARELSSADGTFLPQTGLKTHPERLRRLHGCLLTVFRGCPRCYGAGFIPCVSPRSCRGCRCGAMGRPVWSCNNPSTTAHALRLHAAEGSL